MQGPCTLTCQTISSLVVAKSERMTVLTRRTTVGVSGVLHWLVRAVARLRGRRWLRGGGDLIQQLIVEEFIS